MKNAITVLSLLVLIIGVLCACSKESDEKITTTRPTTVMGEVATSYINSYGEGHTVIYETDKRETLKMDFCDKDGNLKYSEEYLYDKYGEFYGYAYYDKNGSFVAKYVSVGENEGFYYTDNKPMSESEFSRLMESIGAYDY